MELYGKENMYEEAHVTVNLKLYDLIPLWYANNLDVACRSYCDNPFIT